MLAGSSRTTRTAEDDDEPCAHHTGGAFRAPAVGQMDGRAVSHRLRRGPRAVPLRRPGLAVLRRLRDLLRRGLDLSAGVAPRIHRRAPGRPLLAGTATRRGDPPRCSGRRTRASTPSHQPGQTAAFSTVCISQTAGIAIDGTPWSSSPHYAPQATSIEVPGPRSPAGRDAEVVSSGTFVPRTRSQLRERLVHPPRPGRAPMCHCEVEPSAHGDGAASLWMSP